MNPLRNTLLTACFALAMAVTLNFGPAGCGNDDDDDNFDGGLSDTCLQNPSDPRCADFCVQNPEDPACVGGGNNPGQAFNQIILNPQPDFEQGANLGNSVAFSGDGQVIAVGAPGFVDPNNPNIGQLGAVFIFDGPDFANEIRVQAPNSLLLQDQDSPNFGAAVELNADGSVLMVGAPGEDSSDGNGADLGQNGFRNSGAVYVFQRQADGTYQNVQVLAHIGDPIIPDLEDAAFGSSLSANISELVIGAPFTRINNGTNFPGAGSAVVFELDNGQFVNPVALFSHDIRGAENFGKSVSIVENRIVIGAPSPASNSGEGRAYLYEKDAGGNFVGPQNGNFVFFTNTQDPDDQATSRFGESVAIEGNTIIVGAPAAQSNADPDDDNAGLVFSFDFTDLNIAPTILDIGAEIDVPVGATEYEFGSSVAIVNGKIIVGAAGLGNGLNGEDNANADYIPELAGGVFVFDGENQTLATLPNVSVPGDTFENNGTFSFFMGRAVDVLEVDGKLKIVAGIPAHETIPDDGDNGDGAAVVLEAN